MDLSISAQKIRPWLFAAMMLVVAAGVAAELLRSLYALPTDRGWVPVFSLSYEWNLPTVYTAALIVLCVLALGVATAGAHQRGERFVGRWAVLALGFSYIGLDELIGIHEKADRLVQLNHIFYFDWIVPASAVLVVVGVVFFPFLRRLPPATRRRFVLAGAIYVGGAVGMEIPLGWWTARHGSDNLGYGLIDAVEESMEMLGLNLFLLALVQHLASQQITLRFTDPPRPEDHPEASPETTP